MSDRGRGRGPSRPEFVSRPLGRMQDFGTGRGGVGKGPNPGNRPLGSAPVRTSSGGLSSLAGGSLGAPLAAGGTAAGAPSSSSSSSAAGGRGAGPDHREVRYADGVLAMINVLRLLALGGPRTWDASMQKQLGMQIACRPSPGLAGREVNLMVNHFTVNVKPGSSMAVYSVEVTRCGQQQPQQDQQPSSSEAPGASTDGPRQQQRLPHGLVQRALQQLASESSWPASWVLVSSNRLATSSSSFLPTDTAIEASVTLQQQQQCRHAEYTDDAAPLTTTDTGTYKVRLSYLGTQDINNIRNTAAVDAAASSAPLLDGIHLLEALLKAAALQTPPKPPQAAAPPAAAAASPATAPVPVPGAVSAAPAAPVGSLGSAGTGLMGLAGAAGTPGTHPAQLGLAGAAGGGPGSGESPGAGWLSAASGQAAAAGAPTAAGASPGAGSALSISASIASAARVQIGDTTFLHAPGNPDVHAPLGGGLEGWLGYTHKVLQTQSGSSLVVDLTAAPFFEPGPLLGLLPALLGRPTAPGQQEEEAPHAAAAAAGVAALSSADHWRLQQQLKGIKVEVSLPHQPVKVLLVCGLSPSSASSTHLTLHSSSAAGDAGRQVSVQQYFKAVYGLELTAPHLPCIDVGHSSSSSSSGQHIWYPLELCSLPHGQRFRPPLEPLQLAALARLCAKKATDRKIWLEAFTAPLATAPAPSSSSSSSQPVPVPGAAAEPTGSPTAVSSSSPLSGSGVELSSLLGIARARVLPAPHLAYQQPECCYPGSQGQWNVKNCRLPGVSKISSWVLVVLLPQAHVDLDSPSGVVPFMQDLTHSLNSMGMEAAMPPIVFEQAGMSVLQHLRAGCDAAQKHFNTGAELLLVMLPSRSSKLYTEVKMASDAALGLPSQVMVAPVAGVGKGATPRGRLQYCANLGLKINAKMGGVNMRLAGNPDQVIPVVGGRPFILFGVALAPPSSVNAAPGTPAAAAVVASRDRSLGRYSSRVLLQPWEPQQQPQRQPNSTEPPVAAVQQQSSYIVQGLKGAAKELLIDFYRQNGGRKPEALLCYRAVSREGQGQELVAAEYEALRAACFELEESYCPPVTFITVSRSHTTRLFPADRDNQDKSGNCVPGTVVDTSICHPTQFDFFLNSHAGLQGHNKPAHYHVLVDENGFTADGLQLLTYWLCYLYCRCTRSVSMVPPAYYAQLAAERGRLIATGRELLDMGTGVAGLEAAEAAADDMAAGLDFDLRVNAKLGGSMYYV